MTLYIIHVHVLIFIKWKLLVQTDETVSLMQSIMFTVIFTGNQLKLKKKVVISSNKVIILKLDFKESHRGTKTLPYYLHIEYWL